MVCLTKEMPQMDKSMPFTSFSVKKMAAGLIFCAFSCKLKSNHAFGICRRKCGEM